MIEGLSATDFDNEQWLDYLTYHRDWLIRFLVANVAPAQSDRETILAEFAPRITRMDQGLEILANVIRTASDHPGGPHNPQGEPTTNDERDKWHQSVGIFFEHVVTYRDRPEYDQDPYTDDYSYLPLFKVLHGAANQFGLRLSNEAYMQHILGTAAERALSQLQPQSPITVEV